MNLGELRTRFKTLGGFDLADAKADEILNDRYRVLVARARWRLATIDLGATVTGQVAYALPDEVVDLEQLSVGSIPYTRVGYRTLAEVRAGLRGVIRLSGEGLFAPAFGSDGTDQIELYPAPSEDGAEITGLAALEPATLVADGDTPAIPVDLHDRIVDGAVAVGLALMDERLPEADRFEGRFEDGVTQLARRKNSRVGGGVVRIQVKGYDW